MMASAFWFLITLLYALAAYCKIAWFYLPLSLTLFVLAILGTFALFNVNSTEFAKNAIDRNLGWSLYLANFVNTGVLVYLGWTIVALIYGTMILMGLAKRLVGVYKLSRQNT